MQDISLDNFQTYQTYLKEMLIKCKTKLQASKATNLTSSCDLQNHYSFNSKDINFRPITALYIEVGYQVSRASCHVYIYYWYQFLLLFLRPEQLNELGSWITQQLVQYHQYGVGFSPGVVNYNDNYSKPQVIKFTTCLPMVDGFLRVLRPLPPLKLVAMIQLKYC